MPCPRKNCKYCGKFFKPHPHAGNRQKSCRRPECDKKRKQESQQKWCSKNPDYFKNRYADLLSWRKKNPDYQSQWRKRRSEIQDLVGGVTALKSIRFVRPVVLLKNEIKDLVVYVTVCLPDSYDTMEGVGEIQDLVQKASE